jgi:hypothetical protein
MSQIYVTFRKYRECKVPLYKHDDNELKLRIMWPFFLLFESWSDYDKALYENEHHIFQVLVNVSCFPPVTELFLSTAWQKKAMLKLPMHTFYFQFTLMVSDPFQSLPPTTAAITTRTLVRMLYYSQSLLGEGSRAYRDDWLCRLVG